MRHRISESTSLEKRLEHIEDVGDVGALPVDFVAGGAVDEFLLGLEHKWRDTFLDVGFRDWVESGIAQ